jgi:Superfamily II DNA and RNA helicases
MENTFEKLGINQALIDGLKKFGINEPTDIQQKVIPSALLNKDIIGQSNTGTGKTLAYLLPAFQKIDFNKREMQVLILAPTHELVMQISRVAATLAEYSGLGITTTPIIGNINIARQVEKLKEKPHIIVGSAGRTLELIKKKKISAHTIKTIIIDEADKLLDINNIETVKAVIKTTLKERQLMMFSASMTQKSINTAKELMKEYELITTENKIEVNSNITHLCFQCENREKIETLRKLINAVNPKKAIIFINNSVETEFTTSKLKYHKLNADCIHGTNSKEERKRVLDGFRNNTIQLLVTSDIAARGLDIQGVTHIFNLDIPEDPMDYLHRVGRTGRAGNEGTALSIVTEHNLEQIKKIEKTYNITIQMKRIFKGNII